MGCRIDWTSFRLQFLLVCIRARYVVGCIRIGRNIHCFVCVRTPQLDCDQRKCTCPSSFHLLMSCLVFTLAEEWKEEDCWCASPGPQRRTELVSGEGTRWWTEFLDSEASWLHLPRSPSFSLISSASQSFSLPSSLPLFFFLTSLFSSFIHWIFTTASVFHLSFLFLSDLIYEMGLNSLPLQCWEDRLKLYTYYPRSIIWFGWIIRRILHKPFALKSPPEKRDKRGSCLLEFGMDAKVMIKLFLHLALFFLIAVEG